MGFWDKLLGKKVEKEKDFRKVIVEYATLFKNSKKLSKEEFEKGGIDLLNRNVICFFCSEEFVLFDALKDKKDFTKFNFTCPHCGKYLARMVF